MGAWGPGNFENDAALNWLQRLGAHDLTAIREALAAEDKLRRANAGCVCLAAAELLAARAGHPAEVLPESASTWLLTTSTALADLELALTSVRAIAESSELQLLFDDGERNDDWHAELDDLVRRLTLATDRARPSPTLTWEDLLSRETPCRKCKSAFRVHGPLDGPAVSDLRDLLQAGKPISAIQRIRELTGAGLRDAKAMYEHLAIRRGECRQCRAPLLDTPVVDCPRCRALNING